MSNLIVESSKAMSWPKLKEALIAEAKRQEKPFGLIIRDVTGGNTDTSGYAYQAFKGQPRLVYKVDANTGAESLVRGVEIVGTPLCRSTRSSPPATSVACSTAIAARRADTFR